MGGANPPTVIAPCGDGHHTLHDTTVIEPRNVFAAVIVTAFGLGILAGRNERVSVLQYNEPERAAFVEAIKADIDDEFAKRIGQAVEIGRRTRRAQSAQRRASRLLGG